MKSSICRALTTACQDDRTRGTGSGTFMLYKNNSKSALLHVLYTISAE